MTSQSSQEVEYAFRCSSRSVENERRGNEELCLSRYSLGNPGSTRARRQTLNVLGNN